MNYRIFTTVFLTLMTVAFPLLASENTVLDFGPATGSRLVITTANQENKTSVQQIERLAEKLSENPPKMRVSLIITENDFSVLPEEIRTGYPEGTNAIISLLEEGEGGAVILLNNGKENEVLVRNGIKGQTSPRWIVEKTAQSLEKGTIPWNLEEESMPLYRLGWMAEDPLLSAYIKESVPALLLETNADITPTLLDFIKSIDSGIPSKNDYHYLVTKYKGHLFFIGESFMVIIMIIASGCILFFLFIFSFLFGKKKDQHIRDLFHIWWLPFLYLGVNIVCLFIAGALLPLLFTFRFGNPQSWILMSSLALTGKLIISWFFITLIVSLNQLIHFPEDSFIYGYIASFICMINIFVFSSLDFSLCLLFLTVYVISFITYHIKHPIGQIFGIIILFLPFVPSFVALFHGGVSAIEPLYTGSDFWNIRIALFAMPFQLMISRLFHTIGFFGRKNQFYIPVNLIAVFVLTISCISVLLFFPAWSKEKPLIVQVRESIDEKGRNVRFSAPVELHNLVLGSENNNSADTAIDADPASYIDIHSSSQKFLDRQLATITIQPVLPIQKIEVTISSDNGLSVYDASYPFELRKGGQESFFSSRENPLTPFSINFSSDLKSNLSATVRVWSRTNPKNLVIQNKGLSTDYLLEVVRTVTVAAPGERVATQ